MAQIQASHTGEYNTTEKKSVSTHCEIRFQIWYNDVLHERTSLGSPKKSVHFVFGDFPLPIMLNVHAFGTKIKIRTRILKS